MEEVEALRTKVAEYQRRAWHAEGALALAQARHEAH